MQFRTFTIYTLGWGVEDEKTIETSSSCVLNHSPSLVISSLRPFSSRIKKMLRRETTAVFAWDRPYATKLSKEEKGASHEKLIISYTIRFLLILFSSLFLHCFRPLEMNVRRRHVHIHISNSFCAARTSQLSLSPPPLSVDSTTCNDLNQDGDFYLIGPTPALTFSDACAKWNFHFYGWTRALCCCCWLKCKKFLLATKYFFNCSLVFRSIPIFPSRREQAAKTTQESGAREFAECRYNIN